MWEKVGNEYHLTREAELKLTNVLDWIVSRFGIEEYSANVTGSITSNQYDEDSDVDLHVHSSLIKDGMEDEFNKVLRKEFKELFADKPEGMIGNLPIEVYFQVNPYQDMMSVGCYDLLEHKWIVGPEFKDMNYDPFGEFYKDDMRTRSAILNNIRDIIFKIHEDSIVLSETRDEDLIEEISERFVDNLKTAKDILDRARDSRSAYSAPKSKEQALKIRDSRKWKIADSAFKLMDQFGYTWILRQFSTCYKKIEENPNNIVKVVDYISNNIMNDSESREEIQENNTFDIDWGDLIVVGKNIPNGIEPVDDGISPDGVVKESGNTFEDSLDISKEDIDITLKDFKSKFVSQAFPKMDISD